MSSRGPGGNSRGRGGKFKKFTRGGTRQASLHAPCLPLYNNSNPPAGGKHFSRDLRPVDADGNEVSMWAEDAQTRTRDSGSEESESGSESDSEHEDAGAVSREDRKKEKKARKEAAIARKKAEAVEVGDLPPSDDDEDDDSDDAALANPNHSKASRDMVGEVTKKLETVGVGSNRRERESAEAAAAREKYRVLHEQGKTDEAKADLARLKVIREQREAERARRQVCAMCLS